MRSYFCNRPRWGVIAGKTPKFTRALYQEHTLDPKSGGPFLPLPPLPSPPQKVDRVGAWAQRPNRSLRICIALMHILYRVSLVDFYRRMGYERGVPRSIPLYHIR